jgi:hypothetical protein
VDDAVYDVEYPVDVSSEEVGVVEAESVVAVLDRERVRDERLLQVRLVLVDVEEPVTVGRVYVGVELKVTQEMVE